MVTGIINFLHHAEPYRAATTLLVTSMNLVLLIYIARIIRRRTVQFERHHRIVATVAPMIGLVRALQEGLDTGGLAPDQRQAIYTAFHEQTLVFYEALGVEPPKTQPSVATLRARSHA